MWGKDVSRPHFPQMSKYALLMVLLKRVCVFLHLEAVLEVAVKV